MKTVKELWDQVNACETVADCLEAEKAIRESDMDNETYDDLMMAVAFIHREANTASLHGLSNLCKRGIIK